MQVSDSNPKANEAGEDNPPKLDDKSQVPAVPSQDELTPDQRVRRNEVSELLEELRPIEAVEAAAEETLEEGAQRVTTDVTEDIGAWMAGVQPRSLRQNVARYWWNALDEMKQSVGPMALLVGPKTGMPIP